MDDFTPARRAMVETQLRGRGIADVRILDAMGTVPREQFVARNLAAYVYNDEPLPIASGQTISQPYMVASMLAAAGIEADERVLEVGTGSGYAAAVLGRLAKSVISIERDAVLLEAARARLDRSIELRRGDGSLGWPEASPFDAILVMAAAEAIPPALQAQLAPGGRLIIPLGDRRGQRLMKLTKVGDDYREEDPGPVMFVPLVPRP